MRTVLAVVLALMLVVPAAEAAGKPAIYFLRDAELAPGVPAPMLPGILSTIPPPAVDLENVTNNDEPPGTRIIYPLVDAAVNQQFVTHNDTYNQNRIYGPILVLAYVPKTPAVQNANLSIQLVVLPSGADVTTPGTVLASASVAVDGGNQTLPNPQNFVPPNPGDPQGAAAYVAGQLLLYGLQKVNEARVLAFLDDDVKDYIVNASIPEGSSLALRFRLEQGSSPLPIPIAVGQPILYDSALAAALVYVPWYAPDPAPTPKPTPTPSSTPPGSPPSPSPPPTSGPSSSDEEKGSPGPSAFLPIVVVLGALLLLRRRHA